MAESPHHAELINADGSWKYTNALADETSPYLRQHAHNPVDWKPWGDAAFAQAAQRDVPIFLSIGYSTCYWCHVMERQVFESPAIASQMNAQFVCIKVDREERPDVDDIYMTATQLLTGSGGWPMSVFLTPPASGSAQSDGVASESVGDNPKEKFRTGLLPFWAGTYIPPTPAYGRPSFPQVMDAMSQAWRDERTQVLEQGGRVAEAVRQQVAHHGANDGTSKAASGDTSEGISEGISGGTSGGTSGGGDGAVTLGMARGVVGQLLQRYDPTHGGFSGNDGPKFPTPSTIALLLDVLQLQPDTTLASQIQHTLDRMARGGMYDQVGGGFHRYSVDEQWLVPHFEKMLYDNGQLLELYAQAYELWRDQRSAALYARVLRETSDYLLREMCDSSDAGGGAFWSAQDAEVNTKEGENYVWTADQVRDALADQPDAARLTTLAMKMYGLDCGTNFKDPHHDDAPSVNVLFMPEPMSELGASVDSSMAELLTMRDRINTALLKVRDTRDQPGTDDKVLTAWNGLAIAGLADAGRVLNEPRYVRAAQHAADAILLNMSTPDGGLYRSMRQGEVKINGFLEDYAFFVQGLFALDAAMPDDQTRYRDEAMRLMGVARDQFASPGGGYFDTLADQADLFVRTRSTYDGALPSGNSQMIRNLLALSASTGHAAYADRAAKDLRSFAEPLTQSGMGMTNMLRAVVRGAHEQHAAWVSALGAAAADSSGETGVIPGVPSGVVPGGAVSVAVWPMAGEANAWRVVLTVATGFHVNANPASAEGLLATTVSAQGVALDVSYPPATTQRFEFADQPLEVYDGEVEIVVRSAEPIEQVTLSYQACSDAACLEPVEEVLALPGLDGAAEK